MVAQQQDFAGHAVATTLSAAINSSALTFTVGSTAGWPSSGLPFTVTLDQGVAALEEVVYVTSFVGTTITLDAVKGRGYDGGTAVSHALGAAVVHTPDALWFKDISARAFAVSTLGDLPYVSATSGVTMGRVAVGTANQVLGVTAGIPAWVGVAPFVPTSKAINYTAVTNDLVLATATLTVTTPAAHAGATIGVLANFAATSTAAVTITAATGTIIGVGATGAASTTLVRQNAFVVLVSDGTNWFVLGRDRLARLASVASSATPAINTDTTDLFEITALATAITSMSSGLTGTFSDGQYLTIRITDNGTAQAITWGASFEPSRVALPTTTVISQMLTVGLTYNSVTSKFRCVAVV